MTGRKRNVAQEKAYVDLMIALDEMKLWNEQRALKQSQIPKAWYDIERDVPVRPRKTKLTAAFDTDLVKWYRAMGHGYQARMNAVLRAYMKAVVSKEIESHGDRDWKHEQIWGLPDKLNLKPLGE